MNAFAQLQSKNIEENEGGLFTGSSISWLVSIAAGPLLCSLWATTAQHHLAVILPTVICVAVFGAQYWKLRRKRSPFPKEKAKTPESSFECAICSEEKNEGFEFQYRVVEEEANRNQIGLLGLLAGPSWTSIQRCRSAFCYRCGIGALAQELFFLILWVISFALISLAFFLANVWIKIAIVALGSILIRSVYYHIQRLSRPFQLVRSESIEQLESKLDPEQGESLMSECMWESLDNGRENFISDTEITTSFQLKLLCYPLAATIGIQTIGGILLRAISL